MEYGYSYVWNDNTACVKLQMECSYFQLLQNMDNLSCYYNFTHS